MSQKNFTRVGALKTVQDFRNHIASLGVTLDCDDQIETAPASPLAQPIGLADKTIGNRWAIHPMEGWDGTTDGRPTDLMIRRWQNFGRSGAKLIWGGEAMAVREDGRANPNQLIIDEDRKAGIARLREELIKTHKESFGRTDDLILGFQLTHSGRFCRPYDKKKLEPRVAYRHPILDKKFGITSDSTVLSDDEVAELIRCYIRAARVAAEIGADFVDIKHCHGYLLHEFLGAHTRPGKYGGSFENRTRILREIVEGIHAECPGLQIGVRLSAFDFVPYRPDPSLSTPGKLGPGIPEDFSHCLPYRYGFGVKESHPIEPDLTETVQFVQLLKSLGIHLLNLSAGSPYYNPHIQRPAMFPPSDGYQPPEDPLVGVARQIEAVAQIKKQCPGMIIVGSGYSYLQEYMPHVAQNAVRGGKVDIVGIGRSVLSYPAMSADVLTKGALATRLICRTFSDCTTGPRNGLVSGCYPLDDFYKNRPEAQELKEIKRGGTPKTAPATKS
jgi:NADPH2 dehydrogenase